MLEFSWRKKIVEMENSSWKESNDFAVRVERGRLMFLCRREVIGWIAVLSGGPERLWAGREEVRSTGERNSSPIVLDRQRHSGEPRSRTTWT